MSYTNEMIVHRLTTTAGAHLMSATATGEKTRLWCGPGNYIVRQVALAPTVTNAIPVAAKFSIRRVTVGKATTTAMQQAVLTMATGANQGKWRVRRNLNISLTATQELALQVTTLASSLKVRGVMLVEPDWDTVENQSTVTAATG